MRKFGLLDFFCQIGIKRCMETARAKKQLHHPLEELVGRQSACNLSSFV
jgi:hypothetical protein